MRLIIFTIIFILGIKINAMNLLHDKNKDSLKFEDSWEFISDRVMGGISSGKAEFVEEDDYTYLQLKGVVSTENNGGFIQVRSSYDIKNDSYEGIKLKVRGIPSEYYIHIRTSFLFLPWQYYSGKFEVTKDWKKIEIPFSKFEKSNFYQPGSFKSSEIESIGFVAFGKNFDAQLDILEAELF